MLFSSKSAERLIWALIALLLLSNYFHVNSWYERAKLRDQMELSRQMLNARAVIQVTLAKAAKENRALTVEEQSKIRELWTQAEYDRVIPVGEL
jgi:hypothetical protein